MDPPNFSTSSKLNDDAVHEILKFLSLPDRKNARLVCKQWERICNRRFFTKNEAFFISNMYNFKSVVLVLKKCQREYFNLKFDQRLFENDSHMLWNTCGHRIESLQFYMCRFPPQIIRQIFIRCVHLNEFTASGGGVVGCCFFNESLPRKKSILQIEKTLRRRNLKTLHLNSLTLALRECDIDLISSCFPELESLKIQLLLNDHKDSHAARNFYVLLKLIDSKFQHLEKLNIEFPYYYEIDPIDFTTVSEYNLSRLKMVSTSLNPFILNGESFNKILSFKFWTSLKLSWFHTSTTDLTVVKRLLDENPLLEKLELFVIISTISHFCDLFSFLVKSRLKSLKIEISDENWPTQFSKLFICAVSSVLGTLPHNETVRYLSVYSKSSAEFSSLFVRYFRNVRDIWVRPGDVNVVFENQKNLKKLKIEPLGKIHSQSSSFQSTIESIEFIDIRPLVLDVFAVYRFPNLKYLVTDESKVYYEKIQRLEATDDELDAIADQDVNAEGNENDNDNGPDVYQNTTCEEKKEEKRCDSDVFIDKINDLMKHIFRKSPLLEAIEFECDYSLETKAFLLFFQSCLYFHNLRYISFYSTSPQIDKVALKHEMKKYFNKSPSLRGVWFETLRCNIFFYYNIVNRRFEFSNVSSYDYVPEGYFFGIHLHDFWHYNR